MELVVCVFLLLGAALAGPASLNTVENGFPVPDDICLGCICEATTNCTLGFKCTRGLCGPFLISEPYWIDAGSPNILWDPNNRPEEAYHRCATDNFCAAATVRSYLTKFAQDCDGDGIVNCNDYAKIHYMGGYHCQAPIDNLLYYSIYLKCMDSVRKLMG
ncbi:lysozyme [Anabrus simplex]|uniref:lysozyme n=1 Tax=Anabrus simplex TaxID=316456 RepID=UPI0035A3CB0B